MHVNARLTMMWGYSHNSLGMFVWLSISSLPWLVLVGVGVWALVRRVGFHAPHPLLLPPQRQGYRLKKAQEILR